ncbi:MAG: prolipoprotein diacylglyceryl transferase [Planctomycetota bacterium]
MTLTLAAWLHTIDPYAIKLWEGGPIRWYGLSYLLGFLLALFLIKRITRVGVSTLPTARAGDLVLNLAIGIVVGGRLGSVLFYNPHLLREFSDSAPYWGVLDLQGGGMSSHGGMIGGILATYLFARRHQQSWPFTLDLMAFSAPLGLFFGRLANFINGELVGRPTAPDFPLAVQFPQTLYDNPDTYRAMVQAYGQELPPHWLDHLQAGNVKLQQAAAAVLETRHPSQLYAAVLEGLIVFAVLLWLWRKPRRAGSIAGAFCITYAVMRLFNEFFRQPDAHLGLQAWGLSRGQWLSIPLLLLGISVIILAVRFKTPRMGAWRRGPWTPPLPAEPATPPGP